MKKIVFTAAALLLAFAAQAQTVWRCGADAKTYSDSPCPEGRAVAAADLRSTAQVASAQDVLARDRALAHELVRERHEREREAASHGSGLAGIQSGPKPPVKPKAVKAKVSKTKKRPPEAFGTSPSAALASR